MHHLVFVGELHQLRPYPRGMFICLLLYSGDVLSVHAYTLPLGVSSLSSPTKRNPEQICACRPTQRLHLLSPFC